MSGRAAADAGRGAGAGRGRGRATGPRARATPGGAPEAGARGAGSPVGPACSPHPHPSLLAARGRKWWRLPGQVEAPVGEAARAGPAGLTGNGGPRGTGGGPRPARSPYPLFQRSQIPLPPRAGCLRPLIRPVITGIPAGGRLIHSPGRGRRAGSACAGGEMLGQGQAPRGPRGRARPAAGPDGHAEASQAPHRAPEPPTRGPDTKGATPVHGNGCPWGTGQPRMA